MSPPPACSPRAKGDTKVLSWRATPKGGAQDIVRGAPQGRTSTTGQMGEQIPKETGEEGHIQFGPQPDTIPEIHMAPESGERPPSKEGCVLIPPVDPVHPVALDDLMEVL